MVNARWWGQWKDYSRIGSEVAVVRRGGRSPAATAWKGGGVHNPGACPRALQVIFRMGSVKTGFCSPK